MRWTLGLEGAPRRVNHAAASVGDYVYSFGGYCTGEDYKHQRPIDVHRLNTMTLEWSAVPNSELAVKGDIPFQRYGHTVVAYGEYIILTGGRNDDGACNSVYVYEVRTRVWRKPEVTGMKPGPRDGHSATVSDDAMYIFGGFEDDTERFSQDVYRLCLKSMTWTHVLTHGMPPVWRDFHSASCLNNRLYIFGGRSDRDGPIHTRHEVYDNRLNYFDIERSTWVDTMARNPPIGRRSHSSFVYGDKVYIFGGYNGNTDSHFNDVHCYDPATNEWQKVEIPGHLRPCPRRRQSCVIVNEKLYLFGGTSPIPEDELNDRPYTHYFNQDNKLKDQADLFVLDFMPTLRTLCLLVVSEHKSLQDMYALPKSIQADLVLFKGGEVVQRASPSSG